MGFRRKLSGTAVAAAATMLLGACGGGPGAPSGNSSGAETDASRIYEKFNNMSGQHRKDELVKAANKDGELVLYTSNTDAKKLVSGFEKSYPSIDVKVYRASSEKVLQRILQESQAGKTFNDVVDNNMGELDTSASKGLFGLYKSDIRSSLRPIAKQDHWTATYINAFTVAWNTNVIPNGQQPSSYLDLAKPKWKGKISLEAGDFDWYGALYTYLRSKKHMTKQQVDSYFEKLAANAKVVKGHTVQGQLLSSGQFGVAMSLYKHTVDKAHFNKKAPVSWQPAVQPMFVRPNGQAIMKDANHPAAALLYMDWVLTEGQKTIVGSYRLPVQKNVPGEKNPVPDDIKKFQVPNKVFSHASSWSKRYDALVRGVPAIGN